MSSTIVNNNKTESYITSFNNSVFDYIRTAVSDVNCMGIMYDNLFFFEKYSNIPSITFKNNAIIDYIINNTSEFYKTITGSKNEGNIYIYYDKYIMTITPNLDLYKITTDECPKIKHFNTYRKSSGPVVNNYNFKDSYTFNEIDELKKNIMNCLNNRCCADVYVDGYCVFDSTSQSRVHAINNRIVRDYIIHNIDCLFEHDAKLNIHMYDEDFIYIGHNICITKVDDIYTVNIERETCGIVYN